MSAAGESLRVTRVADVDELADLVASLAIAEIARRQAGGAVPCVVLTGGTGGAKVLERLGANAPDAEHVDWARVRFLWGDERWVPAGGAGRNDRLADDTLFSALTAAGTPVDPALVHRMPASDSGLSLDDAAAAYTRAVDAVLADGGIDIAVNGLGEDGHIASIFPGRPDTQRDDAETPAAFAVRDSPKLPRERITLSLPTLRQARSVWFLAAGAGKADAVRGLTQGEQSLPASLLQGTESTVLWADDAALA